MTNGFRFEPTPCLERGRGRAPPRLHRLLLAGAKGAGWVCLRWKIAPLHGARRSWILILPHVQLAFSKPWQSMILSPWGL